jgi:hypothetical protein
MLLAPLITQLLLQQNEIPHRCAIAAWADALAAWMDERWERVAELLSNGERLLELR